MSVKVHFTFVGQAEFYLTNGRDEIDISLCNVVPDAPRVAPRTPKTSKNAVTAKPKSPTKKAAKKPGDKSKKGGEEKRDSIDQGKVKVEKLLYNGAVGGSISR